MVTLEKTKQIVSLSITIDGTTYYYEAHSMHRVAEILAGQIKVLETGNTNEFGQPEYKTRIENFEVHYAV